MVIFNSYVKLPEGIMSSQFYSNRTSGDPVATLQKMLSEKVCEYSWYSRPTQIILALCQKKKTCPISSLKRCHFLVIQKIPIFISSYLHPSSPFFWSTLYFFHVTIPVKCRVSPCSSLFHTLFHRISHFFFMHFVTAFLRWFYGMS